MTTKWKTVPSYPDYEASTAGDVRSLRTGRILKGTMFTSRPKNVKGHSRFYWLLCLTVPDPAAKSNGSKRARKRKNANTYRHKMVAEAHLGARPKGHVIAFKDDDGLNCAADNLEYITMSERAYRDWAARKAREATA